MIGWVGEGGRIDGDWGKGAEVGGGGGGLVVGFGR